MRYENRDKRGDDDIRKKRIVAAVNSYLGILPKESKADHYVYHDIDNSVG
jgi:hypothetical protein